MRPRRVAYVIGVFPKLSETFIANELAEVRRRGIEVKVLSLRRPAETLRHPVVAQARLEELVHYEPTEFREILERYRPDLLHAHFATQPTRVARELAGQLHVPFTFTAHRYDIYDKAPPDFAEHATAAGAFATVSRCNAQYVVATFGIPRERIRVIPCGVDLDLFRPPAQRDSAPTPLVVCIARYHRAKNLGVLLRACAELKGRVTFRCVLVGDGPLRTELETLRQELCLEEIVEIAGPATQVGVLGWWHRAAIAVLSSDSEGMPVSLMEAAACGLPAVATQVGGIPELVENGITGLLTMPGDPKAFASAIERLLRDQALRERMGAAARSRAAALFSLERQVDQLLGLWAELLNGRPAR